MTRNSLLISGCGFDESAVDEFGACTDERDQVRAVDGAPGAHRPAANPAEEPGARDLAPQSSAAVPRRGPVRDQRPSLARAAGPAAGRAGRRPRAAAATR